MYAGVRRVLFVVAACLLWLTACETTSTTVTDLMGAPKGDQQAAESGAAGAQPDTTITGSVPPPPHAEPLLSSGEPGGLLGDDPKDDLSLGKKQFRANNFGLAEQHFRRAVESGPRDVEAWVGLAASYDRLRRFDLADRAYEQALRVAGRRPEILNNLGYSYLLRGDFKRARTIFAEAQAKDPKNPYIKANLDLLEDSLHSRKAVQ
jgi:tetratricopeptide (TPR) repeat protein